VYEGWVTTIDEDSNWVDYQSFGKFFWDEFDYFFYSPDDTTMRIDSTFSISGDVFDYDQVAVTLEGHPIDDNPEPSPTIVALGAIDPTQFTILRFPADFSADTGVFTVATFSDGRAEDLGQSDTNEYAGIWFLTYTSRTDNSIFYEDFERGLVLPDLPDTGYSYEGWVALNNGDTISTGKFLFRDFQDYDNKYCDLGAIPNFPGEDFLRNPPSGFEFPLYVLTPEGGHALITIEPNPDNDLSRPSNLVVLRGNLPVRDFNVVRNGSYPMANVAALQFPKVNVFFQRQ
jgi:hypothetical protein